MSKPLGIGIGIDSTGTPRLFVTPINRVTDQIWDVIREAINANMTPQQFKNEVIEAWTYCLKEDIKAATDELSK